MAARLSTPARAGLAYFAIIFAGGFVLGTVRTLLLEPALGPLRAVALELPVMLALSWIVAGWLTRGRPALGGTGPRLSMGSIALTCLLAAEAALAIAVFGQSPADYLAGLARPPDALGLAGQVLFGLMPWLRRVSGRG